MDVPNRPNPGPRAQAPSLRDQAAPDGRDTSNSVDTFGTPEVYHGGRLDDFQIRGYKLYHEALSDARKNFVATMGDGTAFTGWMGGGSRPHLVERNIRNIRGTLTADYRCSCPNFKRYGVRGCKHIFAERLRRGEAIVEGEIPDTRKTAASGSRRPRRKRVGADGRVITSIQREAREIIEERAPEMIRDLVHTYSHRFPEKDTDRYRGASIEQRAAALIVKVANVRSLDSIKPVYNRMVADGLLELPRGKSPHQNTISNWMNDPRITVVLHRMLEISARPFREREIAAIVDSSKVSQMLTAHARYVHYGGDDREAADWMKFHAIVGVETLVCMGVRFSGTVGENTHDSKFLVPLTHDALKTFGKLRYILGDKAYFSQDLFVELKSLGLKLIVALKKRVTSAGKHPDFAAAIEEALRDPAAHHELYRLRPKVECFFSMLKNLLDGYCWSRGRPRNAESGEATANGVAPCTAWMNETLCKVIVCNLRRTVEQEIVTSTRMRYAADTCFPAIPDAERLVA